MHGIQKMTPGDAVARLDGLIELLRDPVDSAASVGFLATLGLDESRAYWTDTIAEMERGKRALLVADGIDGSVAGSVQMALTLKANGRRSRS